MFNKSDLTTTDGRKVTILDVGKHNHHAGPDFFNSKVIIDDTTWAGNVEIHVSERDWSQHGHQKDDAYNNVVLHVVYQADGTSKNAAGNEIPVVELLARISRRQIDLYESFVKSRLYIPCQNRIHEVDDFLTSSWLERLLVERLERKSVAILHRLQNNTGDWKQTFFEQLASNFGFKTNAIPMEMLARSIPVQLLAKYQHNLNLLEALIFGQAGLLGEQFEGEYPRKLQNEYAYLRKKHRLVPISAVGWKFGRMRPPNFPTIRLAQLSALIAHSRGLFSKIIECGEQERLKSFFEVSASEYWISHHHFDQPSTRKTAKRIGHSSRENILINTVVPFLFAFSRHVDSKEHMEIALQLINGLSAENNSVVRKMIDIGFPAGNAGRSQALLELKTQYCDEKKCLNCAVGGQLLKSVSNDR